jgi:hypothetical protein
LTCVLPSFLEISHTTPKSHVLYIVSSPQIVVL